MIDPATLATGQSHPNHDTLHPTCLQRKLTRQPIYGPAPRIKNPGEGAGGLGAEDHIARVPCHVALRY